MPVYNSKDVLHEWEQCFVTYLKKHETDDYSHDLSHFQRVWKTAQKIIAGENGSANALVVLAACYFHDIVTLPKNHPDRSQSSQLAAMKTGFILKELSFPEGLIDDVCHAVEAHSFFANIPTRTLEAKIVQDADRMEAVGAIGLARVFYTGGKLGSRLLHAEDPWAKSRELDDRKYCVDHFFCKLLTLGETMKTESGRRLAQINTEFLQEFLNKLKDELG